MLLGKACLAQAKHLEASRQFQQAIRLAEADTVTHAAALSGLEEVVVTEQFRAYCRRFQEEHPEVRGGLFLQWFLEPVQPTPMAQALLCDPFPAALTPDWVWSDLLGDCSYTVDNGLEIRAANGRDLGLVNLSAPRLLQSAVGEFAVQTICVPASPEQPAIGGLLLWKDRENYLRLDRGTRGPFEISFQGCLGSRDVVIGRGRLPAERVLLRLERIGGRVHALCSAEGENWFTVGHTEFPEEEPVEVGLHAIGMIDRTIYPGAYPEGTAIRFEGFELWADARD